MNGLDYKKGRIYRKMAKEAKNLEPKSTELGETTTNLDSLLDKYTKIEQKQSVLSDDYLDSIIQEHSA